MMKRKTKSLGETKFMAIHSFQVLGTDILAAGYPVRKIPNATLNTVTLPTERLSAKEVQASNLLKESLKQMDKMFVQVQPVKYVIRGKKKRKKR